MTSVALDKEARLAVKRLQLHRETLDRPSTFREIVLEGIALLLMKEGLEPMKEPEKVLGRTVVEIKRKIVDQHR